MPRNPKVDQSLGNVTRWRQETEELRGILLHCGLAEELKWRKPCYAHGGKNIMTGRPDHRSLRELAR